MGRLTNFPNGIMASPNLGGGGGNPFAGFFGTGVFFVDGGNGSDDDDGSMNTPKKTIEGAVDGGGAQDTIFVRPLAPAADASDYSRYDESVTVPFAKHGMKIIGATSHRAGDPYYGPWIKSCESGYAFDVYAPGTTIENFVVYNSYSSTGIGGIYLRGISGYATQAGSVGAGISNCHFRYCGTSTEAGVYMNGGGNVVVDNCTFKNCCQSIYVISTAGPSYAHRFINNWFLGDGSNGPENYYIAVAGTARQIVMHNNWFDRKPQTGIFINNTGVVDGMCSGSYFNEDGVTCGTTGKEIIIGGGQFEVVGCWDRSSQVLTT